MIIYYEMKDHNFTLKRGIENGEISEERINKVTEFNRIILNKFIKKRGFYFMCSMLVVKQETDILHAFSEKKIDPLTEEEINLFFQEGYVIRRNVFESQEIENSAKCIDALVERAKILFKKLQDQDYFPTQPDEYFLQDGTPFQVVNVMGSVGYHFDISENNGNTSTRIVIGKTTDGNMSIHRFIWAGGLEPPLLEGSRKFFKSVSQLLGCNKADWIINSIHPKIDSELKFDWHQDVKNRKHFDPDWEKWTNNGKGSYVVAITALTKADESNGGLWGVPGMPGDLYLENIKDFAILKEKAHLDKALPLNLNPGDTIWMHPYFMHGSCSNESGEPRILLINGFSYIDDGTGFHTNTKPYPGKGSAQEVTLKE
jgi:hypothetical protein